MLEVESSIILPWSPSLVCMRALWWRHAVSRILTGLRCILMPLYCVTYIRQVNKYTGNPGDTFSQYRSVQLYTGSTCWTRAQPYDILLLLLFPVSGAVTVLYTRFVGCWCCLHPKSTPSQRKADVSGPVKMTCVRWLNVRKQ